MAKGYIPAPTDPLPARLELCDFNALQQTYSQQVLAELQAAGAPENQIYLDQALLSVAQEFANHYLGLSYQRSALLELVRLWLGLDDRERAIALLSDTHSKSTSSSPFNLDTTLLQFLRQALSVYVGYPHQREALLSLVQYWQQVESREAAICALQQGIDPATDTTALDAAVIAFIQKLPHRYQGQGTQRNALVEGFRHWYQLDSRPAALVALGVNPDLFSGTTPEPADLQNATTQTDRGLTEFIHHIPDLYLDKELQREALLYLAQLWYGVASPEQTIQSLLADYRQVEAAHSDSPDALAPPLPLPRLPHPADWTVDSVQLQAAILPGGSFTWAEATQGGLYLPTNQPLVEAIVQMAALIQQARDRLGRPLTIVRWYQPADVSAVPDPLRASRHALGLAIVFYCHGLTGNQLYWTLNPWWRGGLGRYIRYPYLCYVDARSERARWTQYE
ncbi:peptidase M15A [Leptodesmis sp.]|uniref:peptidase M15A n=1 Tax=Leptodesmis sp. TaxID=3100501 RepID=UPI0040535B4C